MIQNPKCHNPELADRVVRRLEGVVIARDYSLLEYNIHRQRLAEAEKVTPGFTSPTVSALEDSQWCAVRVMVKRSEIIDVMERLESLEHPRSSKPPSTTVGCNGRKLGRNHHRCGAAGLWAAGTAAARGRRVLLLEKNNKPGPKILMSGGTRCNITHHCDARKIAEAFGANGRALLSPLKRLPPQSVVELFEAEGVATKVEETGKVFPVSDRAIDVRDALVRR